jgi:hypothetical protein
MTEPPSLRKGSASWTVKKTEVRLMRMISSKSSSVVLPAGVEPGMPALAKTMSSFPNFSATCLRIALRDLGSVTSPRKPMAWGPRPARAASRVSRFLPVMATWAPSLMKRRAVANPMPLLPPV